MNLSQKFEKHIIESLNEKNKKKLLEIERFIEKIDKEFPNMSCNLYSKELERKFGFSSQSGVLILSIKDNFNIDLVCDVNRKKDFPETNLFKTIKTDFNNSIFIIKMCKNDFNFASFNKNSIDFEWCISYQADKNDISLQKHSNSELSVIDKIQLEFYLDNGGQRYFKELFHLNFDLDFESNLVLNSLNKTFNKNSLNLSINKVSN